VEGKPVIKGTAFVLMGIVVSLSFIKMATANEPELETFAVSDRGVQLFYPRGWQVKEYREQHPYSVTVQLPTEDASLGLTIEFLKYYHASASLDLPHPSPELKTADQLLDKYISGFLEEVNGKLLKQESLRIQDAPARFIDVEAENRSGVKGRMLVLIAAKKDVLAVLHCQVQTRGFETYRDVFDAVIRRVEPFSAGQSVSDNDTLDKETENLLGTAEKSLGAGDPNGAVRSFMQAVQINPGNAAAHLRFGEHLLQAARATAIIEDRNPLLQGAEEQLFLAKNILEVYVASDPNLNASMSRAIFLLGEIGEKERGDLEYAKMLYKGALKYDPDNTAAREALKRCENS